MNSRFYLHVSAVNQVELEREVIQDFLLSPQGFESVHSDLLRTRWHNLVCVECLYTIKSMVDCFCFIRG